MTLSRRSFVSLTAVAGLSGCAAISAVSRASEPLDTYTLSPLAPGGSGAGRGHLVVELPSAAGELNTDRILIKVSPRQAEYLPDARWAEQTPAMVQTVLLNSLLNQGGFRLVSRVGAGLMPDNTLMCEIQALQAELTGPDPTSTQIRIRFRLTVIREADRSIAGSRTFDSVVPVGSDDTQTLILALDNALQPVLAAAVAWVRATA